MLLTVSALAAEPGGQRSQPVAPQDTLARFVLDPDLVIELVAAEPEVVDPVALRFDEYGRLWVVEMRDYPDGPPAGMPPQARIRVLEDRDGDGRFETSRVFAEGLVFPTGLQPWRGGVIVTLAGEIAWLNDPDGDGRAEVRETWFRGFAADNEQLRANHPRLALDNRVYVANGLRGGQIVDLRQSGSRQQDSAPGKPLELGGRDFAFDPQSSACEAVAGMSQFGLTFDDFGRRFSCSNRHPLVHAVIEERYATRNPLLALPSLVQHVAAADNESHVFPLTRAWTTSTLHAGQFTAACGVEIYRGDALPRRFSGGAFTCEPTGNLLHFEMLEPAGASFTARSPYEHREFLATTDEWFRPVALETGPDGALYVADMYRAVIEHPDWMPEELRTRTDLRDGDDRGRIYRLRAREAAVRPAPRLSAATAAELVAELEHPNSWQRETAQRLLIQRHDEGATEALDNVARQGRGETARIHALWALEGLGRLRIEQVRAALDDPSPRVREQAVVLSQRWLGENEAMAGPLREALLHRAGDADCRVRFQAALSLAGLPMDAATAQALGSIALAAADDPWTRRAVATAAIGPSAPLLLAWAIARIDEASTVGVPDRCRLIGEITELVGAARDGRQIAAAVLALGQMKSAAGSPDAPRVVWAGIEGMRRGAQRRGARLVELLSGDADEIEAARAVLQKLTASGADIAGRAEAPLETRLAAINLLRLADPETATAALLPIVQAEQEQTLRIAAIAALADHDSEKIADELLQRLPAESPPVRRAMIDALLVRSSWTQKLLDAIDARRIAAAEIGPAHTAQLLGARNAQVRQRATVLLVTPAPSREEVRQKYAGVFALPAEPARGRGVFEKHCATCHRIGEVGVDVGPDIADSRTKTLEQLLTDILEPNRAVDGSYLGYVVVTAGGLSLTGILASETGSSITLRQAENKTVSLLREDITELRGTGMSLMPEGWDKTLAPQQMADLIAFIKHWRYLDGRTPLGEPVGPAAAAPAH